MTEQVIEVEADSLEEARQQLRSQIPEGLHLLSETVISDGQPACWPFDGDSMEDAVRDAHEAYIFKSGESQILEEKAVRHSKTYSIMVEGADDEESASRAVRHRWEPQDYRRVTGVRLVTRGRRGLFGFGKKSAKYEVEVFESAIVEITYTTKAKISARVGKTREQTLEESVGKAVDIGYGWAGLAWSAPPYSDKFSSVVPGTYVVVKVEKDDWGHLWVYLNAGGLQYKVDGGDFYNQCLL